MKAPAAGPVGRLVYTYATRSLWWSDDLFRLYGFEPGEVVPTTELALFHQHPEDADTVRAVADRLVREGGSWALWHRILDANGALRHVVSTGASVCGEDGALRELRGWVVDVTAAHRGLTAERMDEAVRRSAETRSAIEQAKGVLIATLGVDEERAFELLRRASQHDNVKVRDLARAMMAEVTSVRGRGVPDAVTRLLVGAASGDHTPDRARDHTGAHAGDHAGAS